MKYLKSLKQKGVKFEWITCPPDGTDRVALLIPQYNEASNFDFGKRLSYFENFAAEYENELDIIIIDDGSTDNSLEKIGDYCKGSLLNKLHVARVYPNTDKVGALFLTALSLKHEFVILSDFDTDIVGYPQLQKGLKYLADDASLMGYYFKMIPFEGGGKIFLLQQIEYAVLRALYRFHEQERSVPVMPGAGSCYKREVLLNIYTEHSGYRSGEDRESTLIGMKQGYKTLYNDSILVLTRPPLSFKGLVKQRTRWNLGYIETFYKEQQYYRIQIKRLSSIGIRTFIEMFLVAGIMLLPLIVCVAGLINFRTAMISGVVVYITLQLVYANLLFFLPAEFKEIQGNKTLLFLLYPFFRLSVSYLAWMGAFISFFRKMSTYSYRSMKVTNV